MINPTMNAHNAVEYDIIPCSAPRMTQKSKWAPSKAVLKYFDFKDQCRFKKMRFYNGCGICFVMPMPKSYNRLKRETLLGKAHEEKPDIDNMLKAVMDALYFDDKKLHYICHLSKIWGNTGKIIIYEPLDGSYQYEPHPMLRT